MGGLQIIVARSYLIHKGGRHLHIKCRVFRPQIVEAIRSACLFHYNLCVSFLYIRLFPPEGH